MDASEDLIRLTDACQRLGVKHRRPISHGRAWRIIRSGLVPGFIVRNKMMLARSDVARLEAALGLIDAAVGAA